MQERVYNKGKTANVEELRQRIVDKWERLDQRIIDGAVKEWWNRLRACAAAEGGQFEHELWLLCWKMQPTSHITVVIENAKLYQHKILLIVYAV